jgi:hypothetical protein
MQESILSQRLIFLQQDGYFIADDILESLISRCSDGVENHWKQFGSIQSMWGMTTTAASSPLSRILKLGQGRLTSRKIDLVRAMYPIFNLAWPGPNTTLEEGQIRLLEHMGQDAALCSLLYGPVGLPSPWSWAPLTFLGCGGPFLLGAPLQATSFGLYGWWKCRHVRFLRVDQTDEIYYVRVLAELVGSFHDYIEVEMRGDSAEVTLQVHHKEFDLSLWENKWLMLLAQSPVAEQDGLSFYTLAMEDDKWVHEIPNTGAMLLKRVGAVCANLSAERFLSKATEICAFLS